jgi:murein DD-endopeptidase MepM/ murein hydrolase activator NlpD
VDAQSPRYLPPHAPTNIISGFWDCRPGGRIHRGLDFAGVGPNAGLGTPVVSIGRARVVGIGRPDDDPTRYGRPLRRGRTTERGGRSLPISAELEGYGRVHFFTETYGSWRTGAIVVTLLLEGPLVGHRVRYMHLGAIRPDLAVGQVVEAGEEIGVLGGTAVQHSTPHVHVDVEDPDERRVDLAPYLGLTDPSSDRRGAACQQ